MFTRIDIFKKTSTEKKLSVWYLKKTVIPLTLVGYELMIALGVPHLVHYLKTPIQRAFVEYLLNVHLPGSG